MVLTKSAEPFKKVRVILNRRESPAGLKGTNCLTGERAMWQGTAGSLKVLRTGPGCQPGRKQGSQSYNHKIRNSVNSK